MREMREGRRGGSAPWRPAGGSSPERANGRSVIQTKRPPPLKLVPKLLWLLAVTKPWAAIGMLVITLVGGVIPAFELWVTQHLLDHLTELFGSGAAGFRTLLPWAGWLALARATAALFELVSAILETHLREAAGMRLQREVIKKAQQVPLAYFEHPEFYDALQRANQDMGGRLVNLLRLLFDVSSVAVTLTSFLVVLVVAHPLLAPLMVVGTAPGFWLMMQMNKKTYWVYRVRTPENRRAQYFSNLLTQRDEAKEVRLFTLGDHLLDTWLRMVRALAVERRGLEVRQAGLGSITETVAASAYAGCLSILTLLIVGAHITFGRFYMLTQMVQQFGMRIEQIMRALGGLHEQSLYLGDLYEFLSLEISSDAQTQTVQPTGTAENVAETSAERPVEPVSTLAVTFENVSFAYPGTQRPVLKNVSFTIEPGERIALVGANGAGKSTLIKLMMGLYRPTKGRILLNGQDITTLPEAWVRRQFAAVFQDFVRYQFTVAENIGYGALNQASPALIKQAAGMAGAAEFIETLPDAYEAQLGRPLGGLDLSGGQWQKLAIARALVREAPVVILDEPTAALDPKAEAEVYQQFGAMIQGKTAVLISHRLGSARMSDRILVLKDGQLVEAGTHETLVAVDGEYGRLFRLQAQWYE